MLNIVAMRLSLFVALSGFFATGLSARFVEFSFGQIGENTLSAQPEMLWHALPRPGDFNGDGTIGNNEFLVLPFPYNAEGDEEGGFSRRYTRADGSVKTVNYDNANANLLFHGLNTPPTTYAPELVTCFGYVDPLYTPANASDPQTVPWPWPKLIRVTMTIADPNDATIERTFQFIFEIPERDAS